MSLNKSILETTIEKLELHNTTSNALVHRVCSVLRTGDQSYKDLAVLRTLITVEQIMFSFGDYVRGYKPTSIERQFMRKLAGLGLTRLDWKCMPPTTITLEMLKSMPREELLKQPVEILRTLSNVFIERMLRYYGRYEERSTFTIQELLRYDEVEFPKISQIENFMKGSVWVSVENTRKLLIELGFSHEDGRFMYFGTIVAVQKYLKEKYHLSSERADEIANVAKQEGWIKV